MKLASRAAFHFLYWKIEFFFSVLVTVNLPRFVNVALSFALLILLLLEFANLFLSNVFKVLSVMYVMTVKVQSWAIT